MTVSPAAVHSPPRGGVPPVRGHAPLALVAALGALATGPLTGSTGLAGPTGLAAQDAGGAPYPNYVRPPAELEARLADEPFRIVAMHDNRWEGDRTQRVEIEFRDGLRVEVKWAKAPPGGFAINNQPRYEVAAYALQKLLYAAPDRVVPPTVIRVMPLGSYRQIDPEQEPTFEGTTSVLVEVQYWLLHVEDEPEPDTARLATDPDYARRMGYLNLFTYLIRHLDSSPGNVLVSTVGPPRLFSVDNGVAFRSPVSPRGTIWEALHVRRIPAEAVARLRSLTRAGLEAALCVVAQFRVDDDGRLEPVPPTASLDAHRGVHRRGRVIQLGLTDLEIDELWDRVRTILDRVDAGRLETF